MRRAVFAGSFDPFTIGHADIVRRALVLYDEVIVAVGYNENKAGWLSVEERLREISTIYNNESRVKVDSYSCLTVDYAKKYQTEADSVCLIRGIRSIKDFEYEREKAEINKRISGIETVLLFADPSLSSVSSSVVRELAHFGHDIKQFIVYNS